MAYVVALSSPLSSRHLARRGRSSSPRIGDAMVRRRHRLGGRLGYCLVYGANFSPTSSSFPSASWPSTRAAWPATVDSPASSSPHAHQPRLRPFPGELRRTHPPPTASASARPARHGRPRLLRSPASSRRTPTSSTANPRSHRLQPGEPNAPGGPSASRRNSSPARAPAPTAAIALADLLASAAPEMSPRTSGRRRNAAYAISGPLPQRVPASCPARPKAHLGIVRSSLAPANPARHRRHLRPGLRNPHHHRSLATRPAVQSGRLGLPQPVAQRPHGRRRRSLALVVRRDPIAKLGGWLTGPFHQRSTRCVRRRQQRADADATPPAASLAARSTARAPSAPPSGCSLSEISRPS